MSQIAEAFVRIRPDLATFRGETSAGINAAIGAARIPKVRIDADVSGLNSQVSAGLAQGLSGIGASAGSLGAVTAAALGVKGGIDGIGIAAARAGGLTGSFSRETASGLLVVEAQAHKTSLSLAGMGAAVKGSAVTGQLAGLVKGATGLNLIGGVALTAGAALAYSAKKAGELERELDVLQVVTGATRAEMDQFSKTATELGADVSLPGISAGDAATALSQLAKAGLSVQDTITGAKGALQLATAAEISVADAANLAGSALNVFGLSGDQAVHVADLLTGASKAAQGEIADMGMALQQAGTVSAQAGLSLEQTVGAISLLAKNGLLGSDAGTSLRTTLLRLIPTTKEAQQYTDALGISIDENRTLGEQLPEVIEQYRDALGKLNPVLQQQALTQIFGSDAIRGASILFDEGAVGLEKMTAAVNDSGAAAELSGAKTQGFLGQLGGLGSGLETLATNLGGVFLPPLTLFVGTLADGVGAINDFTAAVKGFDGVEIPDWLGGDTSEGVFAKAADLGADAWDNFSGSVAGSLNPLGGVIDKVQTAENVVNIFRDSVDAAAAKPVALTGVGGAFDVLEHDARRVGTDVGEQTMKGVQQGMLDAAHLPVEQAQAMLDQVVEQGRKAVAAAVSGAQQNLTQLGGELAGEAASVIDASGATQQIEKITADAAKAATAEQRQRLTSAVTEAQANLAEAVEKAPLAREIKRLQEELDASNRIDTRDDLRKGLRNAQEELDAAKKQAAGGGNLTAAQQGATSKFLRPFREEVAGAKDEIGDFNKQANIDTLTEKLDGDTDEITENINELKEALGEARTALVESQKKFATDELVSSLRTAATAQKTAVTQGINDAIDAFNHGLITLPQLNKRLAKLLEDNGVDYKKAGKLLGTAFRNGFEATVKGIDAQGRAILAGPQKPGAGLVSQVVVPLDAAKAATTATEGAQQALDKALLEEAEFQSSALGQIALALTKKPVPRPKASVASRDLSAPVEAGR